jgi:DNA-binding transcriptional LysR family regulator
MDAADLRIFEAVARLGGINRAAAELNTVQSNVTTRIRHLEQQLGVRLFDRLSRGVVLTAAGRRLLPYAHRVRDLLDDARRAVADDGVPAGVLTVGALETTAALRLTPVVARYLADHSGVDLVLRTGTTEELLVRALDRSIEGAFVCGPVRHPDLAEEKVFREELALLAAPHVATLNEALTAPATKIVVLRAGCSYRQRLEDVLARRGVVGLRLLEFGTLEAIVGCVAAGLGITLLPRDLIGAVWPRGRVSVHALPRRDALVDTVFVRRRDMTMSSALRTFLEQARAGVKPAAAAA